jgi:tight adherence protein B
VTIDHSTLAIAGVSLMAGGTFLYLVVALRRPESALRLLGRIYGRSIERHLRCLVSSFPAARLIQLQLLSFAAFAVVAVAVDEARLLYLSAIALVGPPIYLRWAVKNRVNQIEEQLDGWLLLLANMLRTTSSLSDAVSGTATLVSRPLAAEIDMVLKEVQCGASLDQALRSMGARLGSRRTSATLTALLVGRNTGGDLPKLLEETAAALRELRRLEGVLAQKTSESRVQMFVMALAPPVLYWAFRRMDPHFFDPLYDSAVGNLIFGIAITMWLVALVLAHRILKVNV